MIKKLILCTLLLFVASSASATYTQQYTLSQDSVFQNQITVAMLQASIAVLAEATTTAGHISRANFARDVIQHPSAWTGIISLAIASQNNNAMTPLTVPSTVADTLIQTAMNAQWTNLSGYFSQ